MVEASRRGALLLRVAEHLEDDDWEGGGLKFIKPGIEACATLIKLVFSEVVPLPNSLTLLSNF